MGMLFKGRWTEDDGDTLIERGAYRRLASGFRDVVGSPNYPAEAGRYHLFVGLSCPWAHRTIIARRLNRLTDIVSMSVADRPRLQGWGFSQGIDDFRPEDGHFHLHRLYAASEPDFTGRITVPVLWDRERQRIVNNESSEIVRMFNTAFDGIAPTSPDFYPPALRGEIDAVNERVYSAVNNGVYRCGFAKTQAAYEEAFDALFEALDWLEARLSGQRYLAGGTITEADIRLFPTLVRFDAAYYGHFKCNLRRIADYPNLQSYLLDLYQTDGFGETVDMAEIKKSYYGLHRSINPTGIIPKGPALDFAAPHDRDRFTAPATARSAAG